MRLLVWCVLLLLLAGSGCHVRRRPDPVTLVPEEPSSDLVQALPANQPPPANPPPPLVSTPFPERPYIRVHVAGAVVRPGLYPLPRESRVGDAVEAAGGPMPDADLDRLNLADFLRDGDQVRVPRRAPEPPELPFTFVAPRSPRGAPVPEPPPLPPEVGGVYSGRIPSESDTSPAPARSRRTKQPVGVVNLNTATAEELQTLPSIGPVLADRIVEHRKTHGPFERPEDLIEVKGIGPRTFERLRPYVTVR